MHYHNINENFSKAKLNPPWEKICFSRISSKIQKFYDFNVGTNNMAAMDLLFCNKSLHLIKKKKKKKKKNHQN